MAFDLVGVQALVLLQAALGNLPVEDWTLRGEQATMLDLSARFLGCCAESLAVNGRGGGLACAISLRLARSVRLRMWTDTKVQCVLTPVDLYTVREKVDVLRADSTKRNDFAVNAISGARHYLKRSLSRDSAVCSRVGAYDDVARNAPYVSRTSDRET